MPQKLKDIYFQEDRKPFNTRLVLPLESLETIMPLIHAEILLGLADSQGQDKVILHINLDQEKYKQVWSVLQISDNKKIA